MKELGYYDGKFGPLTEMQIPMCDRASWFGDGVYDAGPARHDAAYEGRAEGTLTASAH